MGGPAKQKMKAYGKLSGAMPAHKAALMSKKSSGNKNPNANKPLTKTQAKNLRMKKGTGHLKGPKEPVEVVEEEVIVNEEDEEFFAENEEFASFLNTMDPKTMERESLGPSKRQLKRDKQEWRAQQGEVEQEHGNRSAKQEWAKKEKVAAIPIKVDGVLKSGEAPQVHPKEERAEAVQRAKDKKDKADEPPPRKKVKKSAMKNQPEEVEEEVNDVLADSSDEDSDGGYAGVASDASDDSDASDGDGGYGGGGVVPRGEDGEPGEGKSEKMGLDEYNRRQERERVKEAAMTREERVFVKKNLIAELAENVLEDPQERVKSCKQKAVPNKKSNALQMLAGLCEDSDAAVRKFAVLSIMAIFQDILPGYRIRLPTAVEKAVKVKKKVLKQWQYEEALLGAYQRFLKLLERLVSSHLPNTEPAKPPKLGSQGYAARLLKHKEAQLELSLGVVAMTAMCEMLKSHPHFNFRSNLLGQIVPRADARWESVRALCCGALTEVIAGDKAGDISVELVKMISKLIKNKGVHKVGVMP